MKVEVVERPITEKIIVIDGEEYLISEMSKIIKNLRELIEYPYETYFEHNVNKRIVNLLVRLGVCHQLGSGFLAYIPTNIAVLSEFYNAIIIPVNKYREELKARK